MAGKKKRKRTHGGGDEIDALFDGTLGRKVKRAALDSGATGLQSGNERDAHVGKEDRIRKKKRHGDDMVDRDLAGVLGAIRSAPKGEERTRKKQRAKA